MKFNEAYLDQVFINFLEENGYTYVPVEEMID